MKKIMAVILIGAMSLSMMACSKKTDETTKATTKAQEQTTAKATEKETEKEAEGNDVKPEDLFDSETEGDKIVFRVDPGFVIKQDSWMGVVPAGKEYTKEVDADEVDIYYVYVANFEKKASEKYIYEMLIEDIKGLENGKYTMVLSDTDEDTGKVLLYFPIEIKDGKVTSDLSNVTVNK